MNTTRLTGIHSAERIRRYWREHPEAHLFDPVEVKLHADYTITSNIKDGYPPRREA